MKPAELIECGELMQAHAAGTTTPEQVLRMRELMARAKTEAPAPEVADDKSTPFVDESRRPLLDGGDYNDRLKEICREELRGIARQFGQAAYEIAVAAVVAALKR